MEIKGADELALKFGKMISAVQSNNILNKTALIIRNQAVELAPVDTGALKQSISIDTARIGKNYARVFTSSPYAIFVEFGTGIYAKNGNGRKTGWVFEDKNGDKHWTRGSKPQPFLHPAVKLTQRQIRVLMKAELAQIKG